MARGATQGKRTRHLRKWGLLSLDGLGIGNFVRMTVS